MNFQNFEFHKETMIAFSLYKSFYTSVTVKHVPIPEEWFSFELG